MELIDLFCGAGFAAKGLSAAGFRSILGIDIDAVALLSYAANHRCSVNDSDLSTVPLSAILKKYAVPAGWRGLVWQSSPCQSFSAAGEQRPDDDRGPLLLTAIKAAEALPQAWIVCENVTGLLNRNGRPMYDRLVRGVSEFGRRPVEWRLDARDFGLAPRPRVFLIFPPTGFSGQLKEPKGIGARSLSENIGKGFIDRFHEFCPLSKTEAVIYGNATIRKRYARLKGRKNDRFGRPTWQDSGDCIVTGAIAASRVCNLHPAENRRLTIGERRKLLGIPEEYILCGSREDIERQLGNAVAVSVAEAIGREVARIQFK